MAENSVAQQLRRQRGKPLNNRQVVYLWDQFIASSRAIPTLELTRRSSTSANESVPKIEKQRSSQPKRLKDWVKVNRVLRGASIASSQRHRLLEEDIEELLKPRCGHWNIATDGIPNFPDRLREKLEWAQQAETGWDKSSISIFVDSLSNLPLGINASQFRMAIERAGGTWNHANVGIQITFAASLSLADVVASWSSETQDPHGVLGEDVMAHADFPSPNMQYVSAPPLPMCFNRLKLWSSHIDDDVNEPTRYDIESMALHEIGHCIGLFHRGNGGVMYEIVEKGRHRILDSDAIQAARNLY